MRRLQGDETAPISLAAQLAPLFLQNPVDPDEMLDWRIDYTFKMMAYGALAKRVGSKESWDG